MEGGKPLYSVIIPVRNREGMLPTTLRPWIGRPDCEVIVVDDASADNSATVAEARGCVVIRLPEHQGPAGARNAGLRAAVGDRILFLDADIVVPSGFADAIARGHDLADDLVLLGLRRQQPAGRAASGPPRRDSRELISETYSFNLARHPLPWAMCFSCVLSVPRSLLRRIELAEGTAFDPEFRQWGLEDLELGLRLHASGARWAFALGADSDHQYHDRDMTVERFKGWRSNLARLIDRHPDAAGYASLSDAFDPTKRADFIQMFHSYAGPPPHTPRARVVRLRTDDDLTVLSRYAAADSPDTTLYAVASHPSVVMAATCATLPAPERIALYPASVWEQVGSAALARHRHVLPEEPQR